MATVWTLADGSEVDIEALPEGQSMCYFCMHLHPEEVIHRGTVDRERHEAAQRGEMDCVGCACPDRAALAGTDTGQPALSDVPAGT